MNSYLSRHKFYLSQLLHRQQHSASSPHTAALIGERTTSPQSIFIKDKEFFRRIDFNSILYVEAQGSYCTLHLDSGRKLTLSYTLAEITPRLISACFLRVHRSYIVNMQHIDAFIGHMLCIGTERIPVSKQHRSEVMCRFNILGCTK